MNQSVLDFLFKSYWFCFRVIAYKKNQVTNKSSYSARKMLLDLLGKKSMSLYIAIFMNDLAIEIKNLGLGITVGDHDPFHTSIMHKIKTKQVTGLGVAVEKVT